MRQAASWRCVYHDERDTGITVLVSLELVGSLAVLQVGYVEDACHFLPPVAHSASGIGLSRNAVIIEASQSPRSTSVA